MGKSSYTVKVPAEMGLILDTLSRKDGGNVVTVVARMLQSYLNDIEGTPYYSEVKSEIETRIKSWLR